MTDIDDESPASGERTRSDQPGGSSVDPARPRRREPRSRRAPPLDTPGSEPGPAKPPHAGRVPGGDMSDVADLEDPQEPRATD